MPPVTLTVLDGADRGRVFRELPTPVTIGREQGNSIQLNDERVSRFHLKIQEEDEQLVLTDLESTNGTKVNGEETQLRILRFGDRISLGRSVLWLGTPEQIAQRLRSLRDGNFEISGTMDGGADPDAMSQVSLEFELNWSDDPLAAPPLQAVEPPALPRRLTPGQRAQLTELLEFVHHRLRWLLDTATVDPRTEDVTLNQRKWQSLQDLQAHLARYLREVSEPDDVDNL